MLRLEKSLISLTFVESKQEFKCILKNSKHLFITPINAEVLVSAVYDQELANALSKTISTVDGVGIQLFLLKES